MGTCGGGGSGGDTARRFGMLRCCCVLGVAIGWLLSEGRGRIERENGRTDGRTDGPTLSTRSPYFSMTLEMMVLPNLSSTHMSAPCAKSSPVTAACPWSAATISAVRPSPSTMSMVAACSKSSRTKTTSPVAAAMCRSVLPSESGVSISARMPGTPSMQHRVDMGTLCSANLGRRRQGGGVMRSWWFSGNGGGVRCGGSGSGSGRYGGSSSRRGAFHPFPHSLLDVTHRRIVCLFPLPASPSPLSKLPLVDDRVRLGALARLAALSEVTAELTLLFSSSAASSTAP